MFRELMTRKIFWSVRISSTKYLPDNTLLELNNVKPNMIFDDDWPGKFNTFTANLVLLILFPLLNVFMLLILNKTISARLVKNRQYIFVPI